MKIVLLPFGPQKELDSGSVTFCFSLENSKAVVHTVHSNAIKGDG